MNLEITKSDFEKAVPAAREPKGKIFEVMEDAINYEVVKIESQVLGDVGAQAVEAGTDDALVQTVKRLACVRAFMNEMRGLDLVLTATGFGVVSTQDTAPASKMRVDSLDGQLRRQERLLLGTLLDRLFRVSGWNQQPQRQWNVQTVFFSLNNLEMWAGINHPKPEDWDMNIPSILAADAFLRKHIGNAYMDELIASMTSYSLSDNDARLINRLEADLTLYPTYADSEAYRLNHFTPYENHAEDSAFHFVG